MKAKVVQQEGAEPVAAELVAQAIVKIADGTAALFRSGLNEKAITLLISHSCGMSQRDVRRVLDAMQELKVTYLSPKKGRPER